MEKPATSLEQRKWGWILGTAVAVLVALAILFYLPRLTAAYELYWGQENIRRLFYEDLGLSEAWSSFIAVVSSFFYALAWVPLSLWTYRVMVWRFDSRQLVVAFACWVFVYGHVPLLHALLGTDTCFNQRTGAPMKWYVEDANGDITLYDSGGFDTVTRAEKRPVTSEICSSFARQKANGRPRKITANVRDIEFFDPNSGRARVWYSKTADGRYELFDSRGFNPATSEPLMPVTKEIVAEIMARAKREAEESAIKPPIVISPPPVPPVTAPRPPVTAPRPPVAASIAGVWNGTYFYPDGRQAVPFIFSFDSYGCHGRSEEPNTFGNPSAPKLFANLACSVSSLSPGQAITITKTYDGTGGVSHSVIYTGTVSSDLHQISGQWAINATRGNFSMGR